MLGRLLLLALILGLDCLLRSILPHTETLLAPLVSFGIAAFAVFLTLGYSVLKVNLEPLPFRIGYFAAHLAAIAILCLESAASATGHEPAFLAAPALFPLLFAIRAALTVLALVSLALSCMPASAWLSMLRETRLLALYAAIAGAIACLLRLPLQALWTGQHLAFGRWLQIATFYAVEHLLTPILPSLQVDASAFTIGTDNFAIFVAPACSGLEGLGLVLVFTVAWIAYARRDLRIPRALLLIPCALLAVWTLNIVRISSLMLIGNAGSPEIAMVGFHSQAGWIAFTLVAVAFSIATRNLAWVQRAPSNAATPASVPAEASDSRNVAAYLVPFLAILASSFVSKSASGYFEWLYPLRFLAAIVALWHYRDCYRFPRLNLRFSWPVPLVGLGIFLLWIAPELWQGPAANDALSLGLARLSPSARSLWVVFRICAAILTVPIAEELAFRGFLARRLMLTPLAIKGIPTRTFDKLAFSSLRLLPIVVSSVAFGLMHGRNWLPGILAGLALALLARSRNRLGDAVVAHATANLLLAAWVLARGDFGLW